MILKLLPAIAFLAASATATNFDPGGLEYQSETFSLTFDGDAAELSVTYNNFGSKEEKTPLRKRDLAHLKNAIMSETYVKEAADNGVEILERRLDFDNFMIGAFVKARAKAFSRLFEVFANYALEIDDLIYIIPLNGVVGQATLGEGGKVVIRNERYGFAWPADAKKISFTAAYKTTGVSFTNEMNRQ
jgi:hypothetical protein